MKKQSWIIGLALALALLAGCFGGGSPKGQLTGKIYDESTQELITQSVTVTLDGKAGLVEGGQYSFSELSPGTKYLTVEAEGYQSAADIAVTITSGTVTHDVYLQPETPPLQLGGVKGTITNAETGHPILTDVTVKLDGMPGDVDEEGYSFENVTAGNKELVVEATGYEQYNTEIEIIADQTVTHDVSLTPLFLLFEEILVPAAAVTSFPQGHSDQSSPGPGYDYYMGTYIVTYDQWKEVYDWAVSEDRGENQYCFMNQGQKGTDPSNQTGRHPVTYVNWRDCIVWCNARTEYHNAHNHGPALTLAYLLNGEPVRDSSDSNSMEAIGDSSATGYRLPTWQEWQLAARYLGSNAPTEGQLALEVVEVDGLYWTPGTYASGALDSYLNEEATQAVGWYEKNSPNTTQEVGLKPPNYLGFYDMSGNVMEWAEDWFDGYASGRRVQNGGAWWLGALYLQVNGNQHADYPGGGGFGAYGFRVMRTVP